jgi:GAF domain-containing protein/HAMP domain-containing protein
MPEEGKARTSAPPPVERGGPRGQTEAERFDEERRAALTGRVILIGTIIVVTAIVLYALAYFQAGIWQILVDGGSLVLSLGCLALARRSVNRGKLDNAGYWILLALVISFGAAELVWAEETVYNAISGTALIFLVSSIVLRRKWGAWLITAGLYLAFIFLVNQFEPLPRHNVITESTALFWFDLGLTTLLALAILWQVARTFHTGTIRARLLIAFVAVVLLPAIASGVSASVTSWQSDRQQALDKLELVAVLKEAEINTWVQTLQTELAAALNAEEARADAPILLRQETPPPLRAAARQKVRDSLRLGVIQRHWFEELFLMDLQGRVVASTDATQEGQIRRGAAYFQEGLKGAYVQPLSYAPPPGRTSVVFARPAVDDEGQVLGVMAGRASVETLKGIMRERAGLGQTGEIYLIDRDYALLIDSRFGEAGTPVHTDGTDAVIEAQRNGSSLYDNDQGQPVVGAYHWLPELQVALLAEQDQSEAFRGTYEATGIAAGIALAAVLLSAIVSLFITRSIATPLANLAEAATQVASGKLELTAEVEREDEIGTLARAFNAMTGQLRELIGGLEQRVADRTRDLEQRSAYLEASAEVGRVASSILDAELLMRQAVQLIGEQFGLYYVGLFLLDTTGEWAVLRAGTGEAGSAMLARGHRIRVGEGAVGGSIANAQARVAVDVGEDAVRLATDELPDTRSEAALPLRSRGRVIGALAVQSTQPAAFDEAAIAVLQIMADQVAVALDNARLFSESQATLEAARRAYGEVSREAWARLLRAQPALGYRSDEHGVTSAGEVWRPEMERALQAGQTIHGNAADGEARLALAVPIRVRGDVIGVLDTYKPAEAGEWTLEEVTLLETLADQLGIALESARLYRDTQRRAARERLTREITDKMRRAASVEDIVQAAVDELYRVLGASRTFVRLGAVSSAPEDGNADRER